MTVRPARTALLDPYRLLLWAAILGYVILFTQLAFDLHNGMRTHRSDLGQIDQAVWNSSRGRFLEQTDNGYVATRLTDHVEPILILISPLLWLWNDVRALFLLQVIAVAMGAWLLYEIALRKLDQLLSPQAQAQIWQLEPVRQLTRPLALSLALAYLLTPQLQSAVLTEFHAAPLAVPLLLWAFWAVEAKRWWQFAIAALLVAAVKEEMALLAAGLSGWGAWRFALYAWRTRRAPDPRAVPAPYLPLLLSTAVMLAALAWFYIATFVIVPAHAVEVYGIAESGYFARYGALGDSPLDILRSFLTQPNIVWQIATEPARLAYLRNLLLPLGWLTLLAPEIVLLSLPVLLANLLSAYPAQYYGEFHYSAPLIPYFAVGAAYGLGRLWRWIGQRTGQTSFGFQHLPAASTGMMNLVALVRNSRTALRPLLALVLVLWIFGWATYAYWGHGRGPAGGRFDPTPISAHAQLLPRFVAQIPPDASLTATAAVHPHVSHRQYVYQFPLGLDAPVPAEWALLDVTTNTDMAPGDLKVRVDQLLAADWGVIDAADGFLLLHKGATAKTIPAAFYDFARPTANADASATWSIGVASDWPRWRQTKLGITLWNSPDRAEALLADFAVVLPDGSTLDPIAQGAPPALSWLPPADWQAGDQLYLTTLSLTLPRLWALRMHATSATNATALTSQDGSQQLNGIYARDEQSQLTMLPWELVTSGTLNEFALQATGADLQKAAAIFRWGETEIRVEGWLPTQGTQGDAALLWLQWDANRQWPPELTPFVHLRQGEQNQAQADGPPRFFIEYDVNQWFTQHRTAPDLRALPIPGDAPLGESWQVVLGLYDPQSGQRAEVLDAAGNILANEVVLGHLSIAAPPTPDQACALIPATCASQPLRTSP